MFCLLKEKRKTNQSPRQTVNGKHYLTVIGACMAEGLIHISAVFIRFHDLQISQMGPEEQ